MKFVNIMHQHLYDMCKFSEKIYISESPNNLNRTFSICTLKLRNFKVYCYDYDFDCGFVIKDLTSNKIIYVKRQHDENYIAPRNSEAFKRFLEELIIKLKVVKKDLKKIDKYERKLVSIADAITS